MTRYTPASIEPKWQKYWLENDCFKAIDFLDKPKFYGLDMFPYPSGAGLHVGHPLGYTATDIICRKKRQQGYNVLHPIGWDAFGLPAENYAIKTGQDPKVTTKENIKTFKRQIQALGFSYDWDREITTTDKEYYRWTQWLFLQMYKAGLLYEEEKNMAWCPSCKIVVANEEVEQGTHERCGNPVTRRSLKQWMFRITDYAERLLQDLDAPTVFLFHGWGGDGNNHWFPELKKQCESMGCTVFTPDFPKTTNPQYSEWKTHFERQYADKMTVNSVVIGHSLGCQFACKYLTEKNIEIDQLILVAPPLTDCGIPEIKNFYDQDFDTKKLKELTNRRFVLGSENDAFIPQADFESLAEKIDGTFVATPHAGHLNMEMRPEIQERVDAIEKSILDWTDKVHSMQKHWIGKSEGAEVDFDIQGEKVTVFTTRPDTLFGATYFVMAPEHPLVDSIATDDKKKDIEEYRKVCASKSDLERTELNKDKTGVFTGAYAKNPVNGEMIPVWIADYVMMGYGTGAIMAVPAHDERDYEFATKFGLPIIPVVAQVQAKRHTELDARPVISACIQNTDGQYLLMRHRAYDIWTLPSGGIEQGETLFEALKREVEEETGFVNLDIQASLGSIEENIPLTEDRIKKKKRVVTGYAVRLVDKSLGQRRQKDIAKYECQWMSPKEALKTLQTQSIKPSEAIFLARALGQESKCLADAGVAVNSKFLNGLETGEAKQKMIQWLEEKKLGIRKINYKLRDWIFTRQRYWGEPIPLIHCDQCGVVPMDEKDLPLTLPEVEKYEPSDCGESPLATAEEWVNTPCPVCGKPAKRETSTMPNWAGSSWYWLRYMDAQNDQEFCSKEKGNYWGPVDLYVGGTEHAVLHLLYARFWQKVLYDMGLVEHKEPFKKLINQGLIMGEDGNKMSKSLGNVVNPDDIIAQYGADTLRLYEMFMGPFDQAKSWNTGSVGGCYKFLERVWRVFQKPLTEKAPDKKTRSTLHKTIQVVTDHIDDFKFNTAVSQMMVLVNELTAFEEVNREVLEQFLIILSPFAPHMAEEIWETILGKKETIMYAQWPTYDPALLVADSVTYAVQINGKVRGDFEISKDADKDTVLAHAKSLEKTKKYLEEGTVRKEIFVPGKIVGFVVK